MAQEIIIDRTVPVTPWDIIEEEFLVKTNYKHETIFALSNGYIGMRGTFEEGYKGPSKTGIEGNFINGFYESEIIKYGEKGFGYADKSQTMLNVTNAKVIKLFVDGEEFNMLEGKIEEYKRVLKLKDGIVTRTLVWTSPKGKKVKIETTRIVSFSNKNLAAINYSVTPLNFSGEVKLVSILDGDVINSTPETNARIDYGPYDRVLLMEDRKVEGTLAALVQRTMNTKLVLVTAMENELVTENKFNVETISSEYTEGLEFSVNAKEGVKVTLNKYISYTTSRDMEEDKLFTFAKDVVVEAKKNGFNYLIEDQKKFMDEFWYVSDVEIKGDEELQQGIRFNMFHLLQSAGRDGRTSIGAKGLTGEGYEGHCFWDTEMYALPFFLYSSPDISKKLIEYRFFTLDKARERARQMAHNKGALYPWRTINGEETSPYFPAGTAQYHINADIAFAVQKYFEVTEDSAFYADYCVEILIETARFWEDIGDYIEARGGMFCINGVTGPDEYTAIVNNNLYTNMLAKENLINGYSAAKWLENYDKAKYDRLVTKIGLEDGELEAFMKAADNMFMPKSEELGIYLQDDSFLFKKRWDIKNTPHDKFPLLDNHHPLVLYRHQVCKQADLILILFILSHKFTKEELKANFDYYEPVTVHESSLSACIFSIVASEIGYKKEAYEFFMSSARLDLDDYQKNTKAGIHMANLSGTWMCILNGFAGMRVHDNIISFNPYLPEGWDSYKFKVSYKGRIIEVAVSNTGTTYKLLKGKSLTIFEGEKAINI